MGTNERRYPARCGIATYPRRALMTVQLEGTVVPFCNRCLFPRVARPGVHRCRKQRLLLNLAHLTGELGLYSSRVLLPVRIGLTSVSSDAIVVGIRGPPCWTSGICTHDSQLWPNVSKHWDGVWQTAHCHTNLFSRQMPKNRLVRQFNISINSAKRIAYPNFFVN